MIVIWECQVKAALIEETMREVTENLRHNNIETPCYDVSTSTQMVAEPTPEYKPEEEK